MKKNIYWKKSKANLQSILQRVTTISETIPRLVRSNMVLNSDRLKLIPDPTLLKTVVSAFGEAINSRELVLIFSLRFYNVVFSKFNCQTDTETLFAASPEGAPQQNNKDKPPSIRRGPNPFALLGVASLGFAVYLLLLRTRETEKKEKEMVDIAKTVLNESQTVTSPKKFTKDDVTVVFVLGGPGSGKGTQSENLVKDYGFIHLSAGDLLRAEQQRSGSKYGELIDNCIKSGEIVPMEITIALLEQAMRETGGKRFLIDGFPRAMDQAIKFEEDVVEAHSVLYFDCTEKVMLERLLNRGKTSGRADDNIDTIRKRFKTFLEQSYPVVEYYKNLGKVHSILCDDSPEVVYTRVKKIFNDEFNENK
ncbi:hypothetical protein G9A89_004180 [Geosiphon pyriformis]|nr:hypothetical protein G9A89_004180 [Geosiphon pyriformis]